MCHKHFLGPKLETIIVLTLTQTYFYFSCTVFHSLSLISVITVQNPVPFFSMSLDVIFSYLGWSIELLFMVSVTYPQHFDC